MSEESELNREVALIAFNFLRGIERVVAEAAGSVAALLETDVSADPPAIRGPWQRKIARLPSLLLERGMTTGEISSEVGYDETNTYTVLNTLQKNGLIEQTPGASPKRWRLAIDHRRDRILRASRTVQEGEWTTYGDIAIAVSDDVRLARTVGRVAAKNPAFSHPHRVLKSGGKIPADWRDDEGKGPAECKRRLDREGVSFARDGSADPSARIGWEDIKARLRDLDDDDLASLAA